MEVTILGSGTASPSLERNASGVAVRCSGLLIAVDMGPGTMRRMCEAGIDWKRVDAILITHFHPDHVSDLVPFLFASNYAYGPVRHESFYLVGPQGLDQMYQALVGVYDGWIVPTGNRLVIEELHDGAPNFTGLNRVLVRSVHSSHTPSSRAYRIEADGVAVTITGDTDVSDGIVELAQGTDILICECSMPEGRKIPGHLVPSEAGLMAQKAGVGKLVLTHFYPPCEEADVVAQAAAAFSGEIVKARDLMVIRL
jgi:ribonuclease BN (tRNA processing enzyme)